jgi:hypothetical protein
MRVVTAVLALAVSLVIAGGLWAADEKKPRQERNRERAIDGLEFLRGLNLSDDQKAKVAEIKKEYAPKFKALEEKRAGILTADQKKARDEAVKAAKAAGKTGQELFEAGRAAMKLTDDQKAKLAEVRKEVMALAKEVREKVVSSVLTADQKEQVKERRAHRRDRKPEGN